MERALEQKPGVKHSWSAAALQNVPNKKPKSLRLLQHSKPKKQQPKKQRKKQQNQLVRLHRINVPTPGTLNHC